MAATPPKHHGKRPAVPRRAVGKPVTSASVRAIVRKELVKDLQPKMFDFVQLPVSVDSGMVSSYNQQVSAVVQFNPSSGPLPQTRLGNRITARSLELRGSWQPASASADTSNACRVLVVQTFKPEGAYPIVSDVIPDGFGAACAPYSPYHPLNVVTGHYHKVLWDRVFLIGPGYLPGHFEVTIPLHGAQLTFNDALGTDQLTNSLSVLAVSDSSVFPDPTLSFTSRLNFVDEQ